MVDEDVVMGSGEPANTATSLSVRPCRNLLAILIYFARILFSGWHEAIFDSLFRPRGTLSENFWEEKCTSSRSSRTTLMNS